jgi:chemotaxis protein CheD
MMSSRPRARTVVPLPQVGRRLPVGIAELVVGRRVAIATSWLGVCVAIAIADDQVGVGGVVHAMLPSSRIDRRRAAARPATFVDTAVAELVREVVALGAAPGRLTAWLAGGANVAVDPGALKVGDLNVDAAREALQVARVPLLATALGGSGSRALRLEIGRRCVVLGGRGEEVVL